MTVTLDPSVSKAQIVAAKEKTKSEGLARRRSRRIRRKLQSLGVGDNVQGVIQAVVPEGILVTLNSLGPLNITGLLSKRDLPRQFQVPPDLKESFQRQLLQQDFKVGRKLTCSVEKINPKWNPRMAYNLKLTFENFDSEIDDQFSLPSTPEEDILYDDSDDNLTEEELKEMYNDLRSDRDTVTVEAFRNCEEIVGLLEDTLIRESDIMKTLTNHSVKGTELNYEKFADVMMSLQDVANQSANELDESESDDSSESYVSEIDEADDGDFGGNDGGNDDSDESEEYENELRIAFDELKGKDGKVTVKAFKQWEEIETLFEEEFVTEPILQAILKEAKVKNNMDFDQFVEVYEMIEDAAVGEDQDDDADDDESSQLEDEIEDVFNELKGKDGRVSINTFRDWDDIRELTKEGLISNDDIESAFEEAGVTLKKGMDMEQFFQVKYSKLYPHFTLMCKFCLVVVRNLNV